jgi:hypothetical protein
MHLRWLLLAWARQQDGGGRRAAGLQQAERCASEAEAGKSCGIWRSAVDVWGKMLDRH